MARRERESLIRVVLVEAEEAPASLADALAGHPVAVVRTNSLDDARRTLEHSPSEVVVLAVPKLDLNEVDPYLHEIDVPLVVIACEVDEDLELEALRRGVSDIWAYDSIDRGSFFRGIRRAIERNYRERQRVIQAEREKRVLEREREGLLQQELQLNTILGETTDFVAAVGLDLSARYVNPAGLALLGFERQDRVFGLSILDLHPPQQRARFEHEIIPVVLSEGRWTGPIELVKRKDEVAVLDAAIILHRGSDGEPSFLSIIARDVTGRARIEEQRREAQKIEAVGRLAGGIAHDFNNLLTAISSFGRFAIETVGQTHEIYPDLEEILSAAEKAEGLTRQLLAFSRKQTVAPKVLLMSDMVRDMERMLQRLLREDVLIETQLDSDPWSVRIDPGAMEQVLINLCVNARDAMPNGGRLQVEVRNRTLDATPSIGIRSGEYVQLRVSDEGTGIDPAVLPRIFEPFFTTKEQGKGTGLGLSTCYGVVKQAGGHLDVQSEPGHGSTFSVFLPRAAEESEVSPEQKPRVAIPSARGTGTVLVAEDNEQVRRLAVRILERRGYTVDSVANGKEALELLEKSPKRFDLLLTDVIMPVMGGRELAAEVRERKLDLGVAFMSGFAEDEIVSDGEVLEGVALLAKPFTPPELIEHVRRALRASQPERVTA